MGNKGSFSLFVHHQCVPLINKKLPIKNYVTPLIIRHILIWKVLNVREMCLRIEEAKSLGQWDLTSILKQKTGGHQRQPVGLWADSEINMICSKKKMSEVLDLTVKFQVRLWGYGVYHSSKIQYINKSLWLLPTISVLTKDRVKLTEPTNTHWVPSLAHRQ